MADLKRVLPLPPSPPRAAIDSLARRGQVFQHVAVLGVDDDRAGRHADDEVLGTAAVAVRAAAVLAALGPPVLAMRERRQAVDARLGHHDDAAAVAAVAAVRPAARHVLLAAKAHAAVAAPAGFDFDGDAIDEHGDERKWRSESQEIRRMRHQQKRDAALGIPVR